MWEGKTIQDWTTIQLTSTGDEAIQSQDKWIDAEGMERGVLMLQIPGISGGLSPIILTMKLYIETSTRREGPWTPIATIDLSNAPASDPDEKYATWLVLSSEPDITQTSRFDRYIRWRAKAEGPAAWICFRMVGVFKGMD